MTVARNKKPYAKPAILYRDKVDVLAAVCDSNWVPKVTCRVVGQPSCMKTRF